MNNKKLGLIFALMLSSYAFAQDTGVPLHGFADVGAGFGSVGEPASERPRLFNLGTLDFYLAPRLSGQIKSLFELAFEVGADGGLAVDLERIQLAYTFSDALTIWAGRFHSPYGYWNTAFHHGAQIQPSILRPRFLDFEDHGGILPAHSVGLWGTGGFKIGGEHLNYDFYLVNGDKTVLGGAGEPGTLDFNMRRDDNTNPGVGLNLSMGFRGMMEGFRLGVHGLSMTVNTYAADASLVAMSGMKFYGPYVVYENAGVELYGELYHFANTDLQSAAQTTYSSNAGYAQIGYSVCNGLVPYFRFEQTSLDQADSYFANQESGRSYKREVAGLRYALSDESVVKLELNHTDWNNNETSFNEGRVQYAVAF